MAIKTSGGGEIDLKALQEQGKYSLARLILPLYRAFNAMAQEKYAQRGHAGLTTAHTLLFANLDEAGTRIVTVAERMGTTKQFTGRLVHQLEERGYIHTASDPSDRRATIVTATPTGLQFFADACAVKDEIEGQFMAVAGEENLALLFNTLQKLAAAFSAYEHVGSEHPLGEDD
jgi:DNA-binding MarR family transcriptional regulator